MSSRSSAYGPPSAARRSLSSPSAAVRCLATSGRCCSLAAGRSSVASPTSSWRPAAIRSCACSRSTRPLAGWSSSSRLGCSRGAVAASPPCRPHPERKLTIDWTDNRPTALAPPREQPTWMSMAATAGCEAASGERFRGRGVTVACGWPRETVACATGETEGVKIMNTTPWRPASLAAACCAALAALTLAATGASGAAAVASGSGGGPVVPTGDGPVRGVTAGSIDEFLGIPYAAPPTGHLRWRPPQPPAEWQGVRDATQFGPSCPQPPQGNATFPPGPISEDCLYLNVYTPAQTGNDMGNT